MRAQEIIVRHWPGIIKAVVDKALEGSHQHAKYLGEQAGFPAVLAAPVAASEDESLAALLLRHLAIKPADDSGPADTTPLP